MKTSIGDIQLMPVKEDGKFMFCNNTININGKTSKGDKICILTDLYELDNGKHFVKKGHALIGKIVVRGEEHTQTLEDGNITIEDYYVQLCEYYRSQFYFGKKTTT